jgi:photosystem II stability/assembly factor-like uncharacterized protein
VTDPSRPGALYSLAGDKLFGSTDGGASWRLLSSLPPNNFPLALELAVSGNGTLYVAGGHLLFASSDRGATWTLILKRKYP